MGSHHHESDLFAPREELDEPLQPRVSWAERAGQVEARPFDREAGIARFVALWEADGHLQALEAAEVQRLAGHLDYVAVPADREVIGQDEMGDYLLVVLDGRVAVERVQGPRLRTRLAEARAGDMLGEMSLLDGGARFSSCRTLVATTFAVMDSARMEALVADDPTLGVALLAALSRRLSLRVRKLSARLSALLAQN
jgi:CRP/FNR family transcriptional regulator, cyclic AMP receptor protein